MGSSETVDPQPPANVNEFTNKKSIKHYIQALFHKDSKKKNKSKQKHEVIDAQNVLPQTAQPIAPTPVKCLLANFEKLSIDKKDETVDKEIKGDYKSIEDEINSNFTIKTVDDDEDGRILRYNSNTSEDSGFSEKDVPIRDASDEVAESLDKLKIDEDSKDDGKKKKVRTVFIPRRPIRNNLHSLATRHPYQQINQVNKQTFSGGQVIVNAQTVPQAAAAHTDESLEINQALSHVDANVNNFKQTTIEEQTMMFEIATDYVTDDNLLSDFGAEILKEPSQEFMTNFVVSNNESKLNPVEEFNTNMLAADYDEYADNCDLIYIFPDNDINDDEMLLRNNILTPPRSNEPQYSPMSAQSPSLYSPRYSNFTPSALHNSPETDYSRSPDRESPNYFQSDNENEKSHDIDETQIPSFIMENTELQGDWKKGSEGKMKEKLRRSSSISMKGIKEMQKELQAQFSRKSCCRRDRGTHKKVFQEHILSLSLPQRKNLCMRIANMDIKTAYGVLHHILMGLSQDKCEQDSIHYAMFYLVCQQILAQKPQLFLKEFGLNLLVAAALRCYKRPELTRLLVHTVRAALDTEQGKALHTTGPLFTEVDGRGDTVVIACARAGDSRAAVLAELLLRAPTDAPLFDISHTNNDGYTALHVACLSHNSAEVGSCLHTVHVIIAHGQADIYRGDNKAGDTPLHLAVNSVHCELKLVQTLFLHIHRKEWREYAHTRNRSSVTPLEYARSATKSSARQNYPLEVLDMLKKCR